MGKGNFFKKDIKKRKKERKDRSIKQRILDQKKKVEEKLHHVVEVVSEVEKPAEEKPVVSNVQYLIFDESIISYIMLDNRQVVEKLKQIGNFQYYGFDENSSIGQRAIALFEAEKYIDNSDILEEKKLSKTDCILIELLIDKSVILVTNNALLKKATVQEAKERNVTVKIFDPLEL